METHILPLDREVQPGSCQLSAAVFSEPQPESSLPQGTAQCDAYRGLGDPPLGLRKKEGLQCDLWVWVLTWGGWEFPLQVYVSAWAYGLAMEFLNSS